MPTPTDLLLRTSGLLLAILVGACALAQAAAEKPATAEAPLRTTYGKLPARLCLPVTAESWKALQSGNTRLVLHLQHETTSAIYSPTFHVSLAGEAKASQEPIDQLSMHPDLPGEGSKPDAQHFAVNLRRHLREMGGQSTLCVEVGLEPREDGKAPDPERALRLWATLEPLGH